MAELTQMQQARLAAILGQDPAPFETLISDLMSPSNEQRSEADSIFKRIKLTDPNSLALKLAHLLSASPRTEVRALSTVVLREQLTRGDSSIWPGLTPATQSTIKSGLLSSIHNENSKSVIKKLCDTISELASSILPENEWPEILPFMFQCVRSNDDAKLQESAFLIFSQLAQNIGDTLIPHMQDLHAVFVWVLNDTASEDVRIAALSAVINFIQCLNIARDQNVFQDLVPAMMRTLTEALNGPQEATAQEALEFLIVLAGKEPRFLMCQLEDVGGSMLRIAKAESLEEGTRHLAIEFVITLFEALKALEAREKAQGIEWVLVAREIAPGIKLWRSIAWVSASRIMQGLISRLFAILMEMLLDFEDEDAEDEDAEDEDAGETSDYRVGRECLHRLSIFLSENDIVLGTPEELLAYLAAPEWQKRRAALVALALIGKGDPKAVIYTIRRLSTDLGPDFLDQSIQHVLRALADDFHGPQAQESAFLIFLLLAQNIGDKLIPYTRDLHAIFLQVLSHHASSDVRIAAFGAVTNFIPCLNISSDWADLLPAMMTTLTDALNAQEATAQEALKLLIELARKEPTFFMRHSVDVVGSILQIAETESLEEGTRHLAIEFVITLFEAREKAPGIMWGLGQFIFRLFAILMKMLLDVEGEDARETSNYRVGRECLDRLSIFLPETHIENHTSELLLAYLAASEWQKRHAALVALAQIAKGYPKVMIKNLEQVVNMVLNSFQDPHPQVVRAAIDAIVRLSTDLRPAFLDEYHQCVLPALVDGPQGLTFSAVDTFYDNCTPGILTPYVDGIICRYYRDEAPVFLDEWQRGAMAHPPSLKHKFQLAVSYLKRR